MNTKATIAFAALMVGACSTGPLLAASSPTAKAPPGTDNIAFGYGAGFGASGQSENVVCIGTDSGMNSSGNADCVFIGRDAGKGASGATGRTVINGQFCADAGEDSFSIAPSPSAPRPPIEYRAGTLCENVDFKIETTAANRLAFEKAVADVWLSAFDGDDANDGLSPSNAVRTIAEAYAVAYNGITNGTFSASNEVVVAVAEGRYAPCIIESAITNGIAYIATGDRTDTIIDGSLAWWMVTGSSKTNGVPMAFLWQPCRMTGFTITSFNHRMRLANTSRGNRTMTDGIRFERCDIVGNYTPSYYGWIAGTFVDCDIHGNKVLTSVDDTAVGTVFGAWADYDRECAYLTRCHVWDNDFSVCAELFYSGCSADSCLFEVEFYEGKIPSGGYNTIIAKTFSNPNVSGLTHNKDGQFNTNSFVVVAEPGPGYTDSIYQIAGSCVVSNANLTADRVAAAPSCPSVRSDGRRDYGYRDSGLGYETAFALRADIRFEDGALCVYTNGVKAGTATFTPEAEE